MAKLLPKRLRQARAQYQRQQRASEHASCPTHIKQTGPHMGVYCSTHGVWLKWIPKDLAVQYEL